MVETFSVEKICICSAEFSIISSHEGLLSIFLDLKSSMTFPNRRNIATLPMREINLAITVF